MRLVVFHYHDRPGGVRQVISRGLPLLLERLDQVTETVFLTGELSDPAWFRRLQEACPGGALRSVIHPSLGYASGRIASLDAESLAVLRSVLSGHDTVVWAHNLSVGRNVPLLCALPGICQASGARLWLHHHDWWWDGRWDRWTDWLAAGIGSLEEALRLTVPGGPEMRHFCVNAGDLAWVRSRVGEGARWVGNPLPDLSPPTAARLREARAWLQSRVGPGRKIWLAPVRALRRKNLAEALFLTMSQEEDTCLVTTASSSGGREEAGWSKFRRRALREGWPLIPQVLSGHPVGAPGIDALMAAADAVVMSSLREGFGLPCLEAAAREVPLLNRGLPDLLQNMALLGCRLPGAYSGLPVSGGSFDVRKEYRRKAGRLRLLAPRLPASLVSELEETKCAEDAEDFGNLTLEAQLEVLACRNAGHGAPLSPRVPDWPVSCRTEHWADRMLEESADAVPVGGDASGEVLRRFRRWLTQPLLWP